MEITYEKTPNSVKMIDWNLYVQNNASHYIPFLNWYHTYNTEQVAGAIGYVLSGTTEEEVN